MATIKEIVDQMIEDGVLTREEHDQFIDQISKDGKIDPEEREQISRIFKLIKEGKLTIVDEERAKFDEKRRRDGLVGRSAPILPSDNHSDESEK